MQGVGTYRDLLDQICAVTHVSYENDTMYGFVRLDSDRWVPATWDCAGGSKEGSRGANLVKLISSIVTGQSREIRKPWTFKQAIAAISNARDTFLAINGHEYRILSVGVAGLLVQWNEKVIQYDELVEERFTFDGGKPCCNFKEEWI